MPSIPARVTLTTEQLDALLVAFARVAPILATLASAWKHDPPGYTPEITLPHGITIDAATAQHACVAALRALDRAIRPHVSGPLADAISADIAAALERTRH